MLSEEAQKLCVAENFCYKMPVRLDTYSYLVELEQKKADEPYFSGGRSLEETVEILDNRVQLYLNERGGEQ